jgi:hypothetical protein
LQASERRDKFLLAALIGVPLAYIVFLITHRVLFVRNLLLILPSLAILAGFGFSWLMQRLESRSLFIKAIPITLMIALVAFNVQWISYTAWTIQTRRSDIFADRAVQSIAEKPDQAIYITPAALRLLGNRVLPGNASLQYNGDIDLVLFAYLADTRDEEEGSWPVNFPGASPEIFGPIEINMDWHASWPGVERLVLSTPEIAWQDGSVLVAHPDIDLTMKVQSTNGILKLDGEQFFLITEAGQRINILNSANPSVILALRPLIDSEVGITGRPHREQPPNDWFLLEVSGDDVIESDSIAFQFNSIRLLSELDAKQLACVNQVTGEPRYQALLDNMLPFIDFSDDELALLAECVNG